MDDDGSIYVFEAIIAGLLILTAILFLTGLSGPSQATGSGGIDLSRISADTLSILQARDADCDIDADPPVAGCTVFYENRLDEIVSLAIQGDTDDAEAFLAEVLPSGARYLLRLDNGVESLNLLPAGSSIASTPRGARASETFLVPNWTAHADSPDPAVKSLRPGAASYDAGGAVAFASCTNFIAPNGISTSPDGTNWCTWWQSQVPTFDRAPGAIPYGLWDLDGVVVRVHSDASTDFPVYAVQLLIWPGA